MKKGRYILIPLISVLILCSLVFGIFYNDRIDNYLAEQILVSEDVTYDSFTTKIQDINKLIEDEIVGYVYFGRDTCPVCLEFNKYLEKEVNKNNNLIVYKFDTDYWREDKNFQNVLDKYDISEIPMLIKINENQSFEIFQVNVVEELQLELSVFLNN